MCQHSLPSMSHMVPSPEYTKAMMKQFQSNIEKDDHFLLDLCLRYDWMSVKLCLGVIEDIFEEYSSSSSEAEAAATAPSAIDTKRMFFHINHHTKKRRGRFSFERRKKQQKANEDDHLVGAAKKQLKAKDKWGNNILHAVCFYKPPTRIVRSIMDAASSYPDGPLQLHIAVNNNSATPLCIAAKSGSSFRVVHELLQPEASNLVNGGSIVSIADINARTPFVALTQRYEMLRKIPIYHHESPSLEDVISLVGSTHNNNDDDHPTHDDIDDVSSSSSSALFMGYWYKIESLLKAGWSSTVASLENKSNVLFQELQTHNERGFVFSILHGAAYFAESIPPVLSDLIIRCHPDMINNKTLREGGGILPLHLAVTVVDNIEHNNKNLCSLPPHCNDSAVKIRQTYRRKHFIQQLLKADPTTADCKIPGTNRLPFIQAIASGLKWNIKSKEQADELLLSSSQTFYYNGVAYVSNNVMDEGCQGEQAQCFMEEGPLQILWKYSPDALYMQDPVTRLFPFMLAAAAKPATSTDDADDDDSKKQSKTAARVATKIFRRHSRRKNNENTNNNENQPDNTDTDESDSNSDDDSSNDVLQLDTVYSLLRLFPQAVGRR